MVFDATTRASLQFTRPASTQPYEASSLRVVGHHRRSQSASLLKRWVSSPARTYSPSKELTTEELKPEPTVQVEQVPRDRYGFKKTSQYISSAEYDAWDRVYSEHILRRTKKWHALMKAYGLNTEKPYRFPPKSDKITRYVRKGIPPDFRGAAWFWYGGGHSRLARNPNLYQRLLQDIQNGKLSDNDREHIERDLNRTFPDNIRFKPDMAAMPDTKPRGGGGKSSQSSETSIVQSLRRVLQAFAVHNPEIGYCQSLNFIAGLLLLFLDEDEKKAFTLLEIVTSEYLPGTHGIALEGANIDIAVLMSLIQETMTPIWNKLDDKSSGLAGDPTAQALRLPTVSLATTAWFMSLFVGTLPIEAVLRVWDCLFFEGSKTLFRVALAIFRAGQKQILAVHDSVEIFQVVQTIPRTMLDINTLMEVSFGGRRKGGFGGVSQKDIERRRESRRQDVQNGVGRLHAKDGSWKARLKGRGRA
ncbi:RabGAP/TBC [Piedraia hortae CBS 480.64]|uniref:RabGAP/TBC n=1 Tax=Piedraia hortae CBS 480.64 TaxID=1314780 RepID=A0A6A7C0R8_9PEZI|nr:RabGAP/TBC [Piedraia hortae CBS 480.64]